MGFFFRDRDGIGMEFFYHRVRTVGGGQTVIRFTRCTRHNKRKHARVFFFYNTGGVGVGGVSGVC